MFVVGENSADDRSESLRDCHTWAGSDSRVDDCRLRSADPDSAADSHSRHAVNSAHAASSAPAVNSADDTSPTAAAPTAASPEAGQTTGDSAHSREAPAALR